MTIVLASAGETFIQQSEPAKNFSNITNGSAKLYKLMPDGRRQIVGFAGTGHFLGLVGLETYSFSAEALEPLRLCCFSRSRLRALLEDFPLMQRQLLERAGHELAAAQEQMLLLGRKTARERLASFLVGQSILQGSEWGSNMLHLPMTRADIADYLGLTIETVSRTLTALRSDGIIEVPAPSLVLIRERNRLELLAAGQ
ncbi:MAG: helix-turn-helix domain-containing protein [Acetobacteraceae bacterium]|nr:helix-turn-helix domain-containing protein [Acetobacteraceae bacterium]